LSQTFAGFGDNNLR